MNVKNIVLGAHVNVDLRSLEQLNKIEVGVIGSLSSGSHLGVVLESYVHNVTFNNDNKAIVFI